MNLTPKMTHRKTNGCFLKRKTPILTHRSKVFGVEIALRGHFTEKEVCRRGRYAYLTAGAAPGRGLEGDAIVDVREREFGIGGVDTVVLIVVRLAIGRLGVGEV